MRYLTIIFVFLCFAGCYYDNEEAIYPILDNSCDTTNLTYATSIKQIMDENCVSCHSSASATNGNIKLTTYSDVSTQADRIYGTIAHASGFSPMPKKSAKMADCPINKFDIWIKTGKKE